MDLSNEKVFQGTKEIKYLLKEQEGSNNLIVVLSGFSKPGGPPLYNYVRTLEGVKINKLFILDNYGVDPIGSYYIGENGDSSIEESVIDLIKHISNIKDISFENIITVGSSKGGFASVYFALKYGFGACIAGGPQIYLGNYLFNETSVGPPIAKYIAGGNGEKEKIYLNNIIQSAFNVDKQPQIFIHVGSGDPVYKNHVIPFIEDLEKKDIKYFLDVANYEEHNDLIKFFPPFILEKIDKVLSNSTINVVVPYPIEKIKTPDNVDVFLRDISYYNHTGLYLNNEKMNVEKWNVTFEEGSIPKNYLKSGEKAYNPITISHYGLQHYNLFLLNNDKTSKEKFQNVCNFFVSYIDDKGGFPFNFEHYYYKGKVDVLHPGWYSSMGQGMAISNLTRAYNLTKEVKYLEVARKALLPFSIPSKYGGVMAYFDNFPFFEEYPTSPPSYVYNGFLYSLLGLYDLSVTDNNKVAKALFEDGVTTARRMIGLYDLGDRTAYDLTHFSITGYPPHIARWQYHVTHIHLIKALYAITNDNIFSTFADRWIGYLHGKKLSHN